MRKAARNLLWTTDLVFGGGALLIVTCKRICEKGVDLIDAFVCLFGLFSACFKLLALLFQDGFSA
jgi:hypothetical protein